MTAISQKEYLKKYLGIGKAPGEKKKKKKKVVGDRLKIIDDDSDMLISREIEEDISAANEDAPQIVAVIDERPPSLRIDEETKNSLWKPIGLSEDLSNEAKIIKLSTSFKVNRQSESKLSYKLHKTVSDHNTGGVRIKEERDMSPPRRRQDGDLSPKRPSRSDSGSSPKRRREDLSPKRRKEDLSPKRQNRWDSGLSPKISEDLSPKRLKRSNSRSSSKRRSEDLSPKRLHKSDSGSSSKRSEDLSPQRPSRSDSGSSPKRRRKDASSSKKPSRWGDRSPETPPRSPPMSDKMKKTLDGKKAGLQNARDLVRETTLLKQREDELFQKMSAEVSGRNAATVVRAKKTDKDPEEIARQLEKERKTKEKYDRWGKGMKQVEEQNERIAEQLHEMSKPLARYADDEDLEKYLKEQEREGDPMLNYIRKKKKSKAVAAGIPEKPMYMGEFMPNRFGIRPGYRWDGVDRSNGYEKKWFEVQNAKKASQEDAFKWSTEDM